MLGMGLRHTDRKDIHSPASPEPALSLTAGLAQRPALDFGIALHRLPFADGMQLRVKAHNGAAGHRPQIIRPEHVQQRMGQLRKLVLNLLPQFAGQKGKAFQQPFHIRVGTLFGQKAGKLRMRLGKFPALQPQKAQLIPVEPVQLHSYCTLSGSEQGCGWSFQKTLRARPWGA